MVLKKTIKSSFPLYWLDDEKLVVFKRGYFYIYDVEEDSFEKIGKIKLTFKQNIFIKFSLGRRLFRLYPFAANISAKTNELFFSFCGVIYSLNLSNHILSKEMILNQSASRILSICCCSNGDVYYGEYPTKYDNQPVSIYKRIIMGEWKEVYSFNPNIIRHIHLLKEYKNDLYCFTGDENEQVNILCFKNMDFKSLPIVIAHGEQKYRTCVASFYDDKIYYLTDTPYFENKLNCFDLLTKELKALHSIEGTVIYGLYNGGGFYFSTCVENNLTKDELGNNVKIKINGVNGGVRSKRAIVYYYGYDGCELNVVYSLEKDVLPIKFFGLGTFIFPCNTSAKYLALTSSSLKHCEKSYFIKMK